jgi:cellulose synthase operon protein C
VLIVCLAWLAAFPIVAALVATGEPLRAAGKETLRVIRPVSAMHAQVRAVPAFLGAKPPEAALTNPAAMRQALIAAARRVVGAGAAHALVKLALQSNSLRAGGTNFALDNVGSPLRYPKVERILRRHLVSPFGAKAIAAANDLGALLIYAAALPTLSNYLEPFPQAGPVAFVVLEEARIHGACVPQLNFAFLLSIDEVPRDTEAQLELERAAHDCVGDPTPLWLLGEYQSERADAPWLLPAGIPRPSIGMQTSLTTFADLRKRFPDSAVGWAGAGDAELRIAYETGVQQPFTTRAYFRRALSYFLAAQRIEPNPEIAVGIARAYAGLQQFGAAVKAQRIAVAGRSDEALPQAWLMEYLEQDHAFAKAARVAQSLTDTPHFPVGGGEMMQPSPQVPVLGQSYTEEADGPLSIGADRFKAVSIDLDDESGGAGGGENDLSFIPTYREVPGVTGYSRWCPAWSLHRDEILAGESAKALSGLPMPEGKSIRPGSQYQFECGASSDLLAGIAAYEAGQHSRATHFVEAEHTDSTETRSALARLDDARQNLWRFAGNLGRARIAAQEWRQEAPEEALAFDDSGEIEFLAGRYANAARLFGQAAWLVRSDNALPIVSEAEAELKRGMALARLGREDEALRTLEAADATAESAQGVAVRVTGTITSEYSESDATGAFLSYNALAQIGYEDLAAHRFGLAAEAYEAALERTGTTGSGPLLSVEDNDPYTATYDDLSLAQGQIGKLHEALASARKAVDADPLGPLALATEGYTLARLKRYQEARGALRTAVEQLPSQFSAWNDLGYVQDRLGHRDAAVNDFRHAVGADSHYALGWFNLGVELEHQGLVQALAAQGAFGRAITADHSLLTRSHRLSLDNEVYVTNLDLSKPLPPNWTFSTIEKRPLASSLGLVLALVAALQIGHALADSQGIGSRAGEWLLRFAEALLKRLPGRHALTPAFVAVIATAIVFLMPLLRSDGANLVDAVLLTLGVGAMIAAVWRGRVLVARRNGIALTQRGWRPAIVIGLAAAVVGVTWAPLPIARTDGDAPAVHWIGPIICSAIACVLLVMSVLIGVPIARTLAGSGLIMTASILVPIKPLDGGIIADGKASSGASLALLGGGLFLLLGLW